jgi:hypothetical protein
VRGALNLGEALRHRIVMDNPAKVKGKRVDWKSPKSASWLMPSG